MARLRLLVFAAIVSLAHGGWTPNITSCPPLTPHAPSSIFDLTPNSVKVMALLGDSIGAGFAMDGITGLIDEFRGKVALIGGDSGALTMANFMGHYSGSLQGRSVGRHIGEITGAHYKYHPTVDQLNAAQSGARRSGRRPCVCVQFLVLTDKRDDSKALLDEVVYIVSQMKANPKIDFANDYKIVSILIGVCCTSQRSD